MVVVVSRGVFTGDDDTTTTTLETTTASTEHLQKPPPSWETSKENVEPLKSGRNVTEMEKNARLGKEEKEEKVEREKKKKTKKALAFSSTRVLFGNDKGAFLPPPKGILVDKKRTKK